MMSVDVSGPINLQGKTAIVTGGARGIGASIARTLAREGANVVVSDILPLQKTISEVEEYGVKALGVTCDVSKPEQVNQLVNDAIRAFHQIDILVAGAAIVKRTPFLELSLEEWNRSLEVNTTGMFLTVQAVYRHMAARKSGKIVCIGSISGMIGGIIAGADYVTSKGGVHSLIKAVAKEAAPKGIYVNAIAPGPVKSAMTEGIPYDPEMIPLRRIGEPEDIAEAALFLASQASNYITGTVLHVNGGVYLG